VGFWARLSITAGVSLGAGGGLWALLNYLGTDSGAAGGAAGALAGVTATLGAVWAAREVGAQESSPIQMVGQANFGQGGHYEGASFFFQATPGNGPPTLRSAAEAASSQAVVRGLDRATAATKLLRLELEPEFLVGREQLLADLHARFSAEGGTNPRIMALCGLSGVGKTSVAVEYAHRRREELGLVWTFPAGDPTELAAAFGELAALLGGSGPQGTGNPVAQVHTALEARPGGWLLIFDNAPAPAALRSVLPRAGRGWVLITSQHQDWPDSQVMDVPVLDDEVAAGFLQARTSSADRDAALELARALGGLPLALEQAAAYIKATPLTVRGYLDLFRQRRKDMLDRGEPTRPDERVSTTWQLAFEQLQETTPLAIGLLRLLAWCAPDQIPLHLLLQTPPDRADSMPAELRTLLADPLAAADAVATLRHFSLISMPRDGMVSVHLLVQAVVRDQFGDDEAADWAEWALKLAAASLPAAPADYRSWSIYAELAPHIQAAAGRATSYPIVVEKIHVLRDLGIYFSASEQLRAARTTFEGVLSFSEAVYGSDDPELAKAFGNLGQAQLRLGEFRDAHDNIDRALTALKRIYGPGHPEVAKALGNLSTVQRELGDLAGARASIESALDVFRAAYGTQHPEIAKTLGNLGTLQWTQGMLDEARVSLDHALTMSEAVYGCDHPEVAKALVRLSALQLRVRNLEEAHAGLDRALVISAQAHGLGHPETVPALSNLGAVQFALGELEQAQASLDDALRISEAAHGPGHPEVIPPLINLGAVLRALGEPGRARDSLNRALEISEAVYGREHLAVASVLINLGPVLLALGELSQARDSLVRGLEISRAVYGDDHPEVASALTYLGPVLLALGEPGQARDSLNRALEISEAAYGPGHAEVAKALIYLGAVQLCLGEPGQARDSLNHALEISRAAYGNDHPQVAKALADLGAVQLRLRDLKGARIRLTRSLEIAEAAHGPEHPDLIETLINLSRVQFRLMEPTQARASYDRALEISWAAYGPGRRKVVKTLVGRGIFKRGRLRAYFLRIYMPAPPPKASDDQAG
jgi:tetratricopeptide (TPR) repeat protein